MGGKLTKLTLMGFAFFSSPNGIQAQHLYDLSRKQPDKNPFSLSNDTSFTLGELSAQLVDATPASLSPAFFLQSSYQSAPLCLEQPWSSPTSADHCLQATLQGVYRSFHPKRSKNQVTNFSTLQLAFDAFEKYLNHVSLSKNMRLQADIIKLTLSKILLKHLKEVEKLPISDETIFLEKAKSFSTVTVNRIHLYADNPQMLMKALNHFINYHEIITYGKLLSYHKRCSSYFEGQDNIFISEKALKEAYQHEEPIAKLLYGIKLWTQGKIAPAEKSFARAMDLAYEVDDELAKKLNQLITSCKEDKLPYEKLKQQLAPALTEFSSEQINPQNVRGLRA